MPEAPETFVEAMINGHATADDYEDYVEAWHSLPEDPDAPELHEFLGLTWTEYQVVALNISTLPDIIAEHKNDLD